MTLYEQESVLKIDNHPIKCHFWSLFVLPSIWSKSRAVISSSLENLYQNFEHFVQNISNFGRNVEIWVELSNIISSDFVEMSKSLVN